MRPFDALHDVRSGARSRALPGSPSRDPRSLLGDERAIEGLPIRLVIALVVGVACLSVMMGMIDDFDGLGVSELDAQPDPDTFDLSHDAERDVTIRVVDAEGAPVTGATVILQGESARLEGGARHDRTGSDGEVTFEDVRPYLGPNQQQGTLAIDIQPPGGDYQDERPNTQILVLHPRG